MIDPHYPEEYTQGKVTFFGKDFAVTPDVLIPRLETEQLVRRARQLLQKEKFDQLIDIGTGSGIIALSLADLIQDVMLIDVSECALDIAKKNAEILFPWRVFESRCGDLLGTLVESGKEYSEKNILIVTNLPYIRENDWENMSPDTQYEPRLALFGWSDTGFELYEKLFREVVLFSSFQVSITLLIEFWFDQREICENTLSYYPWKYEFFADYAGIERFCEIRIKKTSA